MDIVISPEKTLYINPETAAPQDKNFILNFNKDYHNGLLNLLNSPELRKNHSTSYWFEFSSEIIKNFCTAAENSNTNITADKETIHRYLSLATPQSGLEYLDYELLENIWITSKTKLHLSLEKFSGGFRQFLEKTTLAGLRLVVLTFILQKILHLQKNLLLFLRHSQQKYLISLGYSTFP